MWDVWSSGADPGLQVRRGALKKIAPSGGRHENVLGYFVWKITILRTKIIFFPILGGGVPRAPPLGSAPDHGWLRSDHMHKLIMTDRNFILIRENSFPIVVNCSVRIDQMSMWAIAITWRPLSVHKHWYLWNHRISLNYRNLWSSLGCPQSQLITKWLSLLLTTHNG